MLRSLRFTLLYTAAVRSCTWQGAVLRKHTSAVRSFACYAGRAAHFETIAEATIFLSRKQSATVT